MKIMNIKEEVYQEIKKIIGDDVNFNDDSLFNEDLGIDSYKAVTILLNLDKKKITFKNEDLPSVKSIKDLLNVLVYYGE